MKRGRYNRPFLHLSTMGVLGLGVLIGPYLADTYPVFAADDQSISSVETREQQSIEVGEDVFHTQESDKPRDKTLLYTVQKGDTISTVAKKFGISTDSIRWENDLESDDIAPGDELKILPVTGIAHKVQKGDSIYNIAKKYDTDAQKIADFPFNDFSNPDTFALVEGQMILVPDGIEPEVSQAQRTQIKRQATVVASAPVTQVAGGGYVFPLPGNTGISQYPAWYHMAIDVTAPVGTPIVAAHAGTVSQVEVGGWNSGYGTNVYIDKGDGTRTHYAHLNGVNVGAGQSVSAGTVVGWVGMTGRTTGPHLHFELYRNGVLVNPLSYLP